MEKPENEYRWLLKMLDNRPVNNETRQRAITFLREQQAEIERLREWGLNLGAERDNAEQEIANLKAAARRAERIKRLRSMCEDAAKWVSRTGVESKVWRGVERAAMGPPLIGDVVALFEAYDELRGKADA